MSCDIVFSDKTIQRCNEYMILATIRMKIEMKMFDEILQTLKSMTGDTYLQRGCLSSRLYRDEKENAVFMVEDIWDNEEDLERYLRSEDYRRILLVLEMACEQPDIKFQTISNQAGLEVVEKARGCKR